MARDEAVQAHAGLLLSDDHGLHTWAVSRATAVCKVVYGFDPGHLAMVLGPWTHHPEGDSMDPVSLSQSSPIPGEAAAGCPPQQALLPSHLSAKSRPIAVTHSTMAEPSAGLAITDSFEPANDPWLTLDAAGTLFRTRASTLLHVPSVLQCAVAPDGPWKRVDVTQPIPVDVDGPTFAHVLDFLRYLRLKKGLEPSVLTRITQAARRLGMDSLETEAKYIYPLRQDKAAAKARSDDWSTYYVYFRECWIRGTVVDRRALRHKVGKAMRFELSDSGQRRCDRVAVRGLQGRGGATYGLCLIEFAEFLTTHDQEAQAEREVLTLLKWLKRLPEDAKERPALLALLQQSMGPLSHDAPFRAQCIAKLKSH